MVRKQHYIQEWTKASCMSHLSKPYFRTIGRHPVISGTVSRRDLRFAPLASVRCGRRWNAASRVLSRPILTAACHFPLLVLPVSLTIELLQYTLVHHFWAWLASEGQNQSCYATSHATLHDLEGTSGKWRRGEAISRAAHHPPVLTLTPVPLLFWDISSSTTNGHCWSR